MNIRLQLALALILTAKTFSFSQCSVSIAVNGATTGCGDRILTANSSGGNWTQKTNVGGVARRGPVAFSIGSKGYIGTGYAGSYLIDFWEYDPNTNAWTQKANFAGSNREGAVGFVIGGKGYVGTGYGIVSGYTTDFWQYDPAANLWLQKASFGGTARYDATGFSINGKGYIGTGYNSGTAFNDFWEYDPGTNLWIQKANFGGSPRHSCAAFNIGSKGYIGSGYSASSGTNDFWEYDPALNLWQQKANMGIAQIYAATAFILGNKGYVVSGYNTSAGAVTDQMWEYDPSVNIWTQRPAMGTANSRHYAGAFSIGSKGYVGNGCVASTSYLNTFWEYNQAASYLWSNGATTQTITASGSNNYTVTVIATNGCTAIASQSVHLSSGPVITVSGAGIGCTGISNTLVANGAATYTWSGNAGNSNSNFVIVTPVIAMLNSYTVTGSSIDGCAGNAVVTISVLPSPTLAIVNSHSVLCINQTGGISVSGANSYSWSNGVTSPIIIISPVVTSTYAVTGTDLNGCYSTAIATQSVINCTGITAFEENNSFKTYPNPNNGLLNIEVSQLTGHEMTVELYSYTGQLICSEKITGTNTQLAYKNGASGIYTLKIIDRGKCIFIAKIIKE